MSADWFNNLEDLNFVLFVYIFLKNLDGIVLKQVKQGEI